MRANEYQTLARRTQNDKMNHEQKMLHALHGMASEVGEVHSIFQHALQHENCEIRTDELIGEIGDLLWFIAEFCDCMGLNLEDMMTGNIEKLKKRYPEGFDTERSIHRHEIEDADANEKE